MGQDGASRHFCSHNIAGSTLIYNASLCKHLLPRNAQFYLSWNSFLSLKGFHLSRPDAGPKAMEVGDQIVIFAGGHAPLAVREETVDGETFHCLLGPVYIYGFDGQRGYGRRWPI